jgi:valyl-tRNA synthetase
METGRDILVFWVARMMLMAAALGQDPLSVVRGEDRNSRAPAYYPPFQTVVLHGLVVDADGKKMSKSKGNAVDPLDVVRGASLEVKRRNHLFHEFCFRFIL